jgi:hypothetical protein
MTKFPIAFSFFLVAVLFCGTSHSATAQAADAGRNSVAVDASFPGGNIVVEKIAGNTVMLRTDLRDTEHWWFYWCFRVRGAAGKTLNFKFTQGAPIGVRGPAISLDEGVTWSWLGKTADTKSFSYTFGPDADPVRFSFGMPYTETHLKSFLQRIGDSASLQAGTLCQSRKGRAVEKLRVGKLSGKPTYRVLLTCRGHCCEMMTSYVLEGLIETVLADDKEGKWFRDNVEFLIVPFVDKDGVEDGDQGKLRRPRDHNRDYDANSIYPETRAIKKLVPEWSEGNLRVTIDLHCPYISGSINEAICLVGSPDAKVWKEQEAFGNILERVQKGPLLYHRKNNLAFGKSWNTSDNFKEGTPLARWASGLPGVRLGTTIEFPYANASGGEVNQKTARLFGKDLARAIRDYLESTK